MNKGIKTLIVGLLTIGLMATIAGCGKKQAGQMPPVAVRTMPVIKQDTTVTYEFVGTIEAQDAAQVKPKVSGMIVAKHIKGGEVVKAGQPLYTIDNRLYEASLLNAQAQLANARASEARSARDYKRYEDLVAKGAVSQQQFDNARAEYQQYSAQAAANSALVNKAAIDMGDTVVRSPITGRLDTKDVDIGTYATAGNTVLITVSSMDPVRVKFTMSENEYLRLARNTNAVVGKDPIELHLTDGTVYPEKGYINEVDSVLGQGTGTITMKATFPNPKELLLPGMFARVYSPGEFVKGALLIPQKAIQEQLDKKFVSIVDAEGKAQLRPVTMGARVGELWIVESGLQEGDVVIVEGFQKTTNGAPVNAQPITMEELYPAKK